MFFHPQIDGVLKKDTSMKVAKLKNEERTNVSAGRKVIYDSIEVDGMPRKAGRLHSGKGSRKNISQRPLDRESSPLFTNKNLKEAMTRSRL